LSEEGNGKDARFNPAEVEIARYGHRPLRVVRFPLSAINLWEILAMIAA
jgi:hypothetical protein